MLKVGVEQYPDEQTLESVAYMESEPTSVDNLLHHPFPFFNAQMLAVIAFHLHDVDLGARAEKVLSSEPRTWTHHYAGTMGPVRIGLALCAAVAGELDRAVALCDQTERLLVDFDCRGLLPLFRTYYVEVLHRRGREPDRELARQLLDRVRGDAISLDSPALMVRAEELSEG